MNKNQLVLVLSERNGYPVNMNEKVLEDFLSVVTECLINGDNVQLSGFGVFDIRVSNPRIGTNPRTFEKLEIDYYARPSFRAGRALKAAIRNSDLAVEKAKEIKAKKPSVSKKIKSVGWLQNLNPLMLGFYFAIY